MKVEVEIPDPEIEDLLSQMGERQFLTLMLEVLRKRNAYRESSGQILLCLEDSEEGLYLIADGGFNWAVDATVIQYGECCYPIASWAKDAECPICNRENFLS